MINLRQSKESKNSVAGTYLVITYRQETHPKKKILHWDPVKEEEIEIHDQIDLDQATSRIRRESEENYQKALLADFDTYESKYLMKK